MNLLEHNTIEFCGFLAKKIISSLIEPFDLSIVILLAGIFAFTLKPWRRWGLFLVSTGTLLLFVSAMPLTARFLIRHLEVNAGGYCDPEMLREKGVRHIVVLAGSAVLDDLTPADRWGRTSILRVMEGIRLWKEVPESSLVLSAGSGPSVTSKPEAMAELPRQLGVPIGALHLETRAWDTADEAQLFSEVVRKEPFALVTSAIHIARAMRLFQDRGTNPIPCPCDFKYRRNLPESSGSLPNAASLNDTTNAIHEYLGLLWTRIRK